MGGGGGKGKESKGMNVLPFVQQFEAETRGVRQNLFSQMNEALATGGVGARMPLIQSATTQSQNQLNQSLSDMQRQFSNTGLQNTPYAQSAMALGRNQGMQSIASIGPQVAQQVAGGAANIPSQIISALMGGLSGEGKGSSKNAQAKIM